MFHSSGSRHEQYLVRSQKKAILQKKKRTSLESEISGADSGYTSSSSTSSPNTSISHVTDDGEEENIQKKKKQKRQNQPPRQPDLVYSCPRPLAFPFHNDDHFLPIAEADPRDVARVSPSSLLLNRSASLQSSKTSFSTQRLKRDTESSYSQQSSILSTIQRGTVRSIRSLFQLPESSSSNDPLSPTTSNPNSLQRLEIKKGTVQSIKDMFSNKKKSPLVLPSKLQQERQHSTGMVGATIGHFESSSSSSKAPFQPVAVNVTKPNATKKSFKSRASEFASRALWKQPSSSAQPPPPLSSSSSLLKKAPSPPQTPPVVAAASKIKAETKSLSARIFPKTWRHKDDPASVQKKNKPTETTEEAPTVAPPVTTVRKMWKSFKNLMSGKKSSRVGVL
ncbi:uncharacterized protein EV154DRAFT_473719 [Mucor mucedo]|uniref:uncharacterized protein n=1 Tax=Mucor mucedo TaxID=29922 RepID=UPI00221EE198|nr:uncharacterized protein EV154DRAFT_473719 [Mucor mucedo]KAI7873139.1 hypothetical protein EV154DRAFT_473719 [Mucor mucedo]